jgi:hypothetical protein
VNYTIQQSLIVLMLVCCDHTPTPEGQVASQCDGPFLQKTFLKLNSRFSRSLWVWEVVSIANSNFQSGATYAKMQLKDKDNRFWSYTTKLKFFSRRIERQSQCTDAVINTNLSWSFLFTYLDLIFKKLWIWSWHWTTQSIRHSNLAY